MENSSLCVHEFEPVYDERSKVLILGSFPSVKSREQKFYYGHPQNRFWKVLARLFAVEVPVTTGQKKELLLAHRVAIWDVIASCEIIGSSDSSIKNVVPADIGHLLLETGICHIYANGKTAEKLYKKYIEPMTGCPATGLPSTSPANAAYSVDKLCVHWQVILDAVQEEG